MANKRGQARGHAGGWSAAAYKNVRREIDRWLKRHASGRSESEREDMALAAMAVIVPRHKYDDIANVRALARTCAENVLKNYARKGTARAPRKLGFTRLRPGGPWVAATANAPPPFDGEKRPPSAAEVRAIGAVSAYLARCARSAATDGALTERVYLATQAAHRVLRGCSIEDAQWCSWARDLVGVIEGAHSRAGAGEDAVENALGSLRVLRDCSARDPSWTDLPEWVTERAVAELVRHTDLGRGGGTAGKKNIGRAVLDYLNVMRARQRLPKLRIVRRGSTKIGEIYLGP